MAAEDIEVRFVGCQPNRLREVLEHRLGGIWFSETHLAAVLPRLLETGAQPKRFIQQRESPVGLPRRRQPDGLVENRGDEIASFIWFMAHSRSSREEFHGVVDWLSLLRRCPVTPEMLRPVGGILEEMVKQCLLRGSEAALDDASECLR